MAGLVARVTSQSVSRVFSMCDGSASSDLPQPLAVLCAEERESVGLVELRAAQQCLAQLVAPLAEHDDAAAAARVLRILAAVWESVALRPVLTARHLPVELRLLLHILHAPEAPADAPGGPVDESFRTWCEARLARLILCEPPAALLQALIGLLRDPGSPRWLKAACSASLSRCVLQPGGVQGLLLSLCGADAAPQQQTQAASHAARLLASPPSFLSGEEYVERLSLQLLLLLFSSSPTATIPPSAFAPRGPPEVETEAAEVDRRLSSGVAALVIGLLHQRLPRPTARHLLQPLLAPLLVSPPAGPTARRGESGQAHGAADAAEPTELSLRRLAHLLCHAPPPPSLCDALLAAGTLRAVLRLLLRPIAREPGEPYYAPEGAKPASTAAAAAAAVPPPPPLARELHGCAADIATALLSLGARGIELLGFELLRGADGAGAGAGAGDGAGGGDRAGDGDGDGTDGGGAAAAAEPAAVLPLAPLMTASLRLLLHSPRLKPRARRRTLRHGEVRRGSARFGEVRRGSARLGEARRG